MPEVNVQMLRRAVEAINGGAWEEARLEFAEAGKWPPADPGAEGSSYLGYEGIRNYLQSWVDNFDDFHLEIVELTNAGDQVFVVVQVSGRGKQSGEETRSPLHALVVRFEEGKILGLTMFMSRDAALQAAGLPESA